MIRGSLCFVVMGDIDDGSIKNKDPSQCHRAIRDLEGGELWHTRTLATPDQKKLEKKDEELFVVPEILEGRGGDPAVAVEKGSVARVIRPSGKVKKGGLDAVPRVLDKGIIGCPVGDRITDILQLNRRRLRVYQLLALSGGLRQ